MKREYPAFYAGASKYIAVPLTAIVLVLVVTRFFATKDAHDLYPLCITAFGISIAMAQLAFRFIPQVRNDEVTSSILYSGEKFSLCAMLVLQLLMIAFCKDFLASFLHQQNPPLWSIISYTVLGGLWTLIGSSAVACWYYGYSSFHRELWLNWKERISWLYKDKP